MTLREFGRLGGKLYREIYGKDPPQKRARRDWRNKVGKYPCGILEQAYRKLTASNDKGTSTILSIPETEKPT
jgi:hypothetical protein